MNRQIIILFSRSTVPPGLDLYGKILYLGFKLQVTMKIKFAHIIAAFGLMFAFTSCKKDPGCTGIWIVEYDNPALIAEIDSVNKTMSLQISSMSPTLTNYQGEVYQSYFSGDFNVVAPFSNFVAGPLVPGDGNPYTELIMYNSETPDTVLDTTYVRAGISRDYIYAMVGLQKSKKTRLVTTTSGSMRIQKIGNVVLAQVIAGVDTVTKNIPMSFTPVRFAVRIGSFNDSVVSTTTGVKINAFNVSGTSGSTLFSDEFKCNSIYVP